MVCLDAGVQARVVVLWRIARRRGRIDQFSGARDIGLAGGAGEQPVVTDAVEALGQDVEQEAPDELVGREGHRTKPRPSVAAVVLVAKGDATLVESEQAAVRDGDAVGVAGEIGEHRLGPGAGWWLGVEEPSLPPERGKMCGKGLPATQAFELAEERQPAAAWASASPSRKSRRNRRESTRTGKRKPGLHCTQRVPSNDIPPAGTIVWRCG